MMLRPEAGALTPDHEDDDVSQTMGHTPNLKIGNHHFFTVTLFPEGQTVKHESYTNSVEETLRVSTTLVELYLMLRSQYFWKVRDSFILPTDDTHFAYKVLKI